MFRLELQLRAIWVHDFTTTKVCVDIHGVCHHQSFCGSLGSRPLPSVILLSEGQIVAMTMVI